MKDQLSKALRYDPFAGDETDSRILSDKIVQCRKPAECHHCGEAITPKSFIRIRSESCEGDLVSFKWCQTCTELMAKADTDRGDDELEKRCRVYKKLTP